MLSSLLLPIGVSAAFTFVASCLVHMVLRYHNADYRKLPDEDGVRAALGRGNLAPGQYTFPNCMEEYKKREMDAIQKKYEAGAVGVLWLRGPGMPGMGKMMGSWFVLCAAISFCVAYVMSHSVPKGAEFMHVFRIAGAIHFIAYGAHGWADVIWKGKPLSCALKDTLDALLYGVAAGAAFGWLWPR